MVLMIPKHVRKRKRDCVNHVANGSSSKNSPPRVSANGRLVEKKLAAKCDDFFEACLVL